MIALNVNGTKRKVDADPETPLLWVLRDNLGITSVKYTCGIAECGICTVLIDGEAQRSCVVNLEDVQESNITTIEGLPEDHPVKVAWIFCRIISLNNVSSFLPYRFKHACRLQGQNDHHHKIGKNDGKLRP